MIGSVPRFLVLLWSVRTQIKGRILSGKIIFCIVNEHTADDLSINRMTKVSANLSKNSLEQWEERDPDPCPVSVSFW